MLLIWECLMCYILNLIWYRHNLYCILFCKCHSIYIMLIVHFLFVVKCKMSLNKFTYIKLFKKGSDVMLHICIKQNTC